MRCLDRQGFLHWQACSVLCCVYVLLLFSPSFVSFFVVSVGRRRRDGGRGEGPCVRSRRPPCVHTGVFQRVRPHTTTTQPRSHTHTTTTKTHNDTQPTCGSIRLNTEQSPGPDTARIDSLLFLDSVSGGACLFSVGGVICLVNSVNERDLCLLNDVKYDPHLITLQRDSMSNARKLEATPVRFIFLNALQPPN